MTTSDKIFVDQLRTVINDYPTLRIKESEQRQKYLHGTIDVYDAEGNHASTFLIEIHNNEGFPYRFPDLYEVGGDIPQEADYHINPDGTCCLAVLPVEIAECKYGISLTQFIEKHVVPYLANQWHKKMFGRFVNEYSHGLEGLGEAYVDIMKTADKNTWVKYIEFAFGIKTLKIGRNEPCLCGNGEKFKLCHDKVFGTLRKIGKENVLTHVKMILLAEKEQQTGGK